MELNEVHGEKLVTVRLSENTISMEFTNLDQAESYLRFMTGRGLKGYIEVKTVEYYELKGSV